MLTDDQIEKLKPLMNHPKYDSILKDAVEIWKREDVTPKQGTWGLYGEINGNWEFDEFNKECCLIGASLVGKPVRNYLHVSAKESFNISRKEYNSLISGFDNKLYLTEYNIEAFDFGKKVYEIVCQM